MTLLIAGLVLFIVSHLIRPFAPGLRNAGIAALGDPVCIERASEDLGSDLSIVHGVAMTDDHRGVSLPNTGLEVNHTTGSGLPGFVVRPPP